MQKPVKCATTALMLAQWKGLFSLCRVCSAPAQLTEISSPKDEASHRVFVLALAAQIETKFTYKSVIVA